MSRACRVAAALAALHVAAAAATAQPLVPLGDVVEQKLLPAGISLNDVEMSGELAYVWTEGDGSHVVQFVGQFELHSGARKVSAQRAVVWIQEGSYEGKEYRRLDIVLWREAEVVDAAGTVTEGPVLFVTLQTTGRIRIVADATSPDSSADTELYKNAERIREAVNRRVSSKQLAESAVTVLEFEAPEHRPPPEARPPVIYRGRETVVEEVEGRRVLTVIGDVLVFRAASEGRDPLELRADAAVVYFVEKGEKTEPSERPGRYTPEGEATTQPGTEGPVGGEALGLEGTGPVEAVYLEGDMVLTYGPRMVRASRLYYDLVRDQAVILDPVVRIIEPRNGLPIYVRADVARQLSMNEFTAHAAKITTSEFYTPHYYLGAEKVTFVDYSPPKPLAESQSSLTAGTFELHDMTVNIDRVPIFYWPYAKGDFEQSDFGLRGVRGGYSETFGAEVESKWELFNVLGMDTPPGVNAEMLLDYYSERGPAFGINAGYTRENYFGLLRSYYVHDNGQDDLGGVFRDEQPDTKNRGRITWRHRQYLPEDWQLTFELSYISDKNFLEEWFENEYDNGKQQETLVYLKKQRDNWAFTSLLNYRILDFVTTTESLPDFAFYLIGQPVGKLFTWYSENHAGWVRHRPADLSFLRKLLLPELGPASGTTARIDSRQEVESPLTIGDLRVVPFGSVRGSAWDDSIAGGGVERFFGTYGLRGSTYAWRVYPDAESDLFDIHGIRHIVKTDVVAWGAGTNRDADDLYRFDETIEDIDDADGVSVGVRQRFQTKRGAADRVRTVDVFMFDVEMGVFNNPESHEPFNGYASYSRPENSIPRNYVSASALYRINDSTDLISEMNYDIDDSQLDVLDVTYAVERTPRLSYMAGYRYISEIDSNLLGAGLNYRISPKYTFAVREEFDIGRGETTQFDVAVIRKFPRWYVGFSFSLDEIEDDLGIRLSAWPEGLPHAVIGTRRYTGLATSTAIQPGM